MGEDSVGRSISTTCQLLRPRLYRPRRASDEIPSVDWRPVKSDHPSPWQVWRVENDDLKNASQTGRRKKNRKKKKKKKEEEEEEEKKEKTNKGNTETR